MTREQLEALLEDMTLEEKVGQMIQVNSRILTEGGVITGPTATKGLTEEQLAMVGSMLGKSGAEELKKVQMEQMDKQPHHIPMMFMKDIINGCETIFPIPLAIGCTFSPEMAEKVGAVAARESAAVGLHVTFSPMVDLVRDARWGRVMESTGEDPYLNGIMGSALVRGYQGNGDELAGEDRVAACLKHFAAYGAPEGGREYENVELSERTLREDYLPAYEACIKEGCCMAMTSFNTINRIPSSGNKWLMRKVLREEMGFDGVLISDYTAVEEMVNHGCARDAREAAKLAIEAGVDIDMVSNAYCDHLTDLVRSGEVEEHLIDEAVMRILTMKNALGLFENPWKAADNAKAEQVLLCEEHRTAAREVAAASFVLLKNEEMLPLSKTSEKRIAFIGPYTDECEMYGDWSFPSEPEQTITIKQGVLKKRAERVSFARGSYRTDPGTRSMDLKNVLLPYDEVQATQWLAEAEELAKKADQVVMCIGEHRRHSGESASRVTLRIPEVQLELLRKVHAINPNIITVLFSGRPVEVKEIAELSKALLLVWMPGTEGGNAIADVLFGDKVPQGKLTMTFPRSVGHVPIYYNRFMSGRPNKTGAPRKYLHGYIDEPIEPLYPFGFGLSYTSFTYSPVTLSSSTMTAADTMTASVMVTNTGDREGTETVQMYLRDLFGSVVRPLRMLKGFEKVTLKPGESKQVTFEIKEEMLRFYDINMEYVSEAGEFEVYIGSDSMTQNKERFYLV